MSVEDYDIPTIQEMFKGEPDFELDLHSIFDVHFTSIDTSDIGYGNDILSLTPKLARKLLHSLSHEKPSERQVHKVLRLKSRYEFEGAKNSWSGDPITIDNKTRSVTDGITRLYAVALAKTGIYQAMKLVK